MRQSATIGNYRRGMIEEHATDTTAPFRAVACRIPKPILEKEDTGTPFLAEMGRKRLSRTANLA